MNLFKTFFKAIFKMLPNTHTSSTTISDVLSHTNSAVVMPQTDFNVTTANRQNSTTTVEKQDYDIENQLVTTISESNDQSMGTARIKLLEVVNSKSLKNFCGGIRLFGAVGKRVGYCLQNFCGGVKFVVDVWKRVGKWEFGEWSFEGFWEGFSTFSDNLEGFCGGVKFMVAVWSFGGRWQCGELGCIFKLWVHTAILKPKTN